MGGVPKQGFVKNAFNFVLLVAVALPSIYFHHYLVHECPAYLVRQPHTRSSPELHAPTSWTGLRQLFFPIPDDWNIVGVCRYGLEHPIATVNVLFFLNVCVLFWILSLLQGSTWLIDPYWTIIPVMIAHFYAGHPLASFDSLRSLLVLVLVWIWSVRLTHSYFRREEWQFGAREDWRFLEYRSKSPSHWWWQSFFIAYFSQQFMLVGVTLPIYVVHNTKQPFHPLYDGVGAVLCIAGLVIAYFADTQLREFMVENEKRVQEGKKPIPILDRGIWYYSRRPNYFGEQLWWWGLAFFAAHLGHPWAAVGAMFNTLVLAAVTSMVEKRMLEKKERADAYKRYMETTSVWLPLPKLSTPHHKPDQHSKSN